MANNIGTLVSSPIRPLSTGMTIPTAFADEIRGGLHSVDDLAGRNQIPTDRREFGMLVYTEASDEFYQLKQLVTTDLFDNSNWQLLAIGASSSSMNEWQDSVISITDDPSVLVPSNGDRYLIFGGINGWLGKDNQIAQFSGTWTYTIPTEGMSVRVDDVPGPIYTYLDTTWSKQEFVDDPLYPQWNIPSGTTVSVSTQSMYLSYGDLQIDGLLNNYGKVVLLNGTISGSGTINNIGSASVQQFNLVSDVIGGTGINITQQSLGTRTVEIDISGGTGIGVYSTGSSIIMYTTPTTPVYPQHTIGVGETLRVDDYQTYFVYGDMYVFGTLDIGTFARVVVVNGSLISATGSTISNPGNLEVYDAIGPVGATGSTGPSGVTGSTGATGPAIDYIDVSNESIYITGKTNSNVGNGYVYLGVGAGSASTAVFDSVLIGRNAGKDTTGTTGSVIIGSNAGKVSQGDYNVFIGEEAGLRNTSGVGNVFIGKGAGLTNSTGFLNTFIGAFAGQFSETGDGNVFIGYETGSGNLGGSDNTFVGSGAGCSNTNGLQNTIVGRCAGRKNTVSRNSFFGYHSGANNCIGVDNTFVGNDSGNSNGFGNFNTFMGSLAGNANIGGHCNTFIGYSAGFSNVTGGLNTFVGSRAGYNNNLGIQNSFMGRDSGVVNTSGNNNTFMGYSSGVDNTIGSNNVFIGFGSGGNSSEGNFNVSIGFGAGGDGASHSIFLGSNTGIDPSASFSSNSIAIGNYAMIATGSQLSIGSTTSPIGTASSSGSATDFLNLTLNGTDFKIQLYEI